MGRFSPTVLPDAGPMATFGDRLSGTISDIADQRRKDRLQRLAEAQARAQMAGEGIVPDVYAGDRQGAALRDQSERITGSVGVPSVDLPNGDGTTRTTAPIAPAPQRYQNLGDTGFRLDTQGTPEARAEARRQARLREMAQAFQGAGLNPGEAGAAAERPELADDLVKQHAATARTGRLASILGRTRLEHPDRAAILAEDPSLLPHELYPPAREMSLQDQIDLARAKEGARASVDRADWDYKRTHPMPSPDRQMTLPQAEQIVEHLTYDEKTGGYHGTAAQRFALARKVLSGTAGQRDFDALTAGEPQGAATPPEGPSLWDKFSAGVAEGMGGVAGQALRGGVREPGEPDEVTSAPSARVAARPNRPNAQRPSVADAHASDAKYRNVPEETRRGIYKRRGYSDAEIRQIMAPGQLEE